MKTSTISLAAVLCLAGRAAASTFTVNNVFDPGNGTCDDIGCTLREAIDAANANPGSDIINFNIPDTGVQTISPTSNLPNITDPLTIDGYTQPGASENTLAVGNDAVLLIELNGANSLTTRVQASNCTIRGLVINRFTTTGILVLDVGNEITNTVIEGNFIGTNPAGTTDLGNAGYGVILNEASNSVVGGTTPEARNLVSGNGSTGVLIVNAGTNNVVAGNYIGTNADGTVALPNDEDGVQMSLDTSGNTVGGTAPGAGNLISGNGRNGINITDNDLGGTGGGNTIQGNLIGTDATGAAALANSQNGVLIENRADNIVGGTVGGERNVISANGSSGVQINGNTASGNQVLGNFIGTDALGASTLGNDQNGVSIVGAPGNIIGGATAGAGNVICGSFFGIQIAGPGAIATQVQGNRIGTDLTGTLTLGNNDIGILLTSGPSDTLIGGSGSAGNIIAFNENQGVFISGGIGNHVFGNSHFSNGRLGMDLFGGTEDANGVTANEVGDADVGPNNLQNYPVVNAIAAAGASRTVEGQLNSAASTDYTLDFYSNSEVDPSGYGEGETFLGSLDVQTDSLGEVFFSFPLEAFAAGQFITATATDPDGNTSEFSMASEAVPAIGRFLNVSTRLRVQTGENVLIGGFIMTGTAPADVLLRAIGPSLGDFGVPDFLANPTLELHFSDGSVITNDDWRNTQEAEIIATGIPPDDDLESAILATLEPGAYTAIVSGVSGGTGVGLVEAYDLSATDEERFANVSTRGLVETEDNVMIGGVIVGSNTGMMARVVVRAIGPSLTDLGVAGALQDPRLELFDSNGMMIQANDNWKDSQQAEIEATGLAPSDDRESALVRDLVPGAYTAIVRGVGDTTGVGLVEAYDIQ